MSDPHPETLRAAARTLRVAGGTFRAADAAELAIVERSGFIESRHLGSAVVTDPDGQPVIAVGAPSEPVYARSCLKPLQAIACMELGVELRGEEAVLATASHRAEAGHVEIVSRMLESGGLTVADLQCPSVPPADRENRIRARSRGMERSPLHFNCSGKHTAFLLAAARNGWGTDRYLDPESEVQQQVAATVEEFCGAPSVHVGVDGCGAPVHALPLTRLARGIGRVAAGASESARILTEAVLAHPWAIDGHGRPNSVTIERLGILAKFGAEGVMVMGTTDGWAVAVKCLDGSNRPTTLAALELLAAAGAVPAEQILPVLAAIEPQVTGGVRADGSDKVVGSLRAGAGLLAACGRTVTA
ncbi:asparaginase [Brevibacterium daeguense]|uniref:Asparaginase n=1 Tax=Brevibacterium daeguense TaxID=909936 RepID=A0ABP8EH72_9MICO|nr:asparaginase [Brevibacterium daeguense]